MGGPLAAWLRETSGSWNQVFFLVILLDLATALTALFVLKRMRLKFRSAVPELSAA
jgi:MFS transporter, OFA family, oxalate/formate antiporter